MKQINEQPIATAKRSAPAPFALQKKAELPLFSRLALQGFGWIFLLWFFWLFLSLCFFNNSTFLYDFWKQSAAALCVIGGVAGGYAGLQALLRQKRQFRRILKNRFLLVFTIGMAAVFVLQMVYVGLETTSIGWDAGTVVRAAKDPMMGTEEKYFVHYPNNLFLLFFFRFFVLVFRFFNLPGVWAGLNVVNTIAVDIAIILAVLAARRILGLKGAYTAWCLALLTIGFFPYLLVPYSDTLSMPFAIGTFYCYLRAKEDRAAWQRIFFSILTGVCACAGYLIKPTAIIPCIAVILIHFLCCFKQKKHLLQSALALCLAGAAFLAGNFSFSAFSAAHFPRDKEEATPMTHFMMMGLHELKLPNGTSMYGAYFNTDVTKTFALPDQESKTAFHRKVIKQRLEEMGPAGYLQFLNNKARWITSEGNFFWGGEGSFANFDYMTDSLIKELINSGSNALGFYLGEDGKTQPGRYFDVYFYFSQGVWILLMGLIVLPLFGKRKGFLDPNIMILRCSIFGLMLFLLLFEGRSRYLINQLPFFILLAAYGLQTLTARPRKKRC